MDATTLFLLRLSGPVLLIVSLSILINGDAYRNVLKEIASGFSLSFFIVALIPLCAGMAMVLVHNRWETIPEVLVSILGWGTLIKGIVRLLFPAISRKIIAQIKSSYLVPWAMVILAWGGYMTWAGYFSL